MNLIHFLIENCYASRNYITISTGIFYRNFKKFLKVLWTFLNINNTFAQDKAIRILIRGILKHERRAYLQRKRDHQIKASFILFAIILIQGWKHLPKKPPVHKSNINLIEQNLWHFTLFFFLLKTKFRNRITNLLPINLSTSYQYAHPLLPPSFETKNSFACTRSFSVISAT